MIPSLFTVTRAKRETHDTVTIHLVAQPGQQIAPFSPGQFNMLYAFGVGEIPVSVSGSAERPHCLEHTTRAVGAVSRALCTLGEGATVGVRGPFGSAWPTHEIVGRDLVIVAGGIGLAPLRPVIYHALREDSGARSVRVLIGARTPRDLLFTDELEAWRSQGATVSVIVDASGEDWTGRVGLVTELFEGLTLDPSSTVAMICGPEIMMHFTVRALTDRGIPESRLYVTMERNMKCATGHCGHCQFGGDFVCKDGPVFAFDRIKSRFFTEEL